MTITQPNPNPNPNPNLENNGNNNGNGNGGNTEKKLKLLPLIFLIYFEVAGGPFGEEPSIKAAGPLFAILGFLIFPFIWSIPEALITAELATAYPGNGGYVIWAERAFGPFWGSMMGTSKFLSGVINNAAYPVLLTGYLKMILPTFGHGLYRYIATSCFTIILAFVNYTGLSIVGYGAVALGAISLCPFILMSLISIPKIQPSRWISMGRPGGTKLDLTLYFNTLFWNLNFWDNASTLAGEVDQPQTTFPKALFSAGLLTCLGYLIPLLAVSGALPLEHGQWDDGYFAQAAGDIAGTWCKMWVEVGALLSTIGLFEAQLSSSSFQLLGMADLGVLPKFFGLRSTWFNTPWVGILVSSTITLGITFLPFHDITAYANFLYVLGMLIEFAAFIRLRKKFPSLDRPFKVPLGNFGVIIMCAVPGVFLVFMIVISKWKVIIGGVLMSLFGVVWYFAMKCCESTKLLEFQEPDEEEQEGVNLENV